MSTYERFWLQVDKQGPRHHLALARPYRGRCYLFTGHKNKDGYGNFRLDGHNGRKVKAHRYAYGPVPRCLELDHLCRRRACVRRSHLEAVKHLVNMGRGSRRNKTHCPTGHPLSGANLYVRPDGARVCRTCQREHNREHRRRAA